MTASREIDLEDACDECGRPMEMTGDSLCEFCHRAEEERLKCICGKRVIFANDYCSDACEEYADWAVLGL